MKRSTFPYTSPALLSLGSWKFRVPPWFFSSGIQELRHFLFSPPPSCLSLIFQLGRFETQKFPFVFVGGFEFLWTISWPQRRREPPGALVEFRRFKENHIRFGGEVEAWVGFRCAVWHEGNKTRPSTCVNDVSRRSSLESQELGCRKALSGGKNENLSCSRQTCRPDPCFEWIVVWSCVEVYGTKWCMAIDQRNPSKSRWKDICIG